MDAINVGDDVSHRLGRVLGFFASGLGLLTSVILLLVPIVSVRSTDDAGRTSSDAVTGIDYLFGRSSGVAPDLFFWSVAVLFVAVIIGVAVWKERVGVLWVLAIPAIVVSILGAMTIGLLLLPFALSLLLSALLLTVHRYTEDG
jgi:hypothetical protein